MKVLSCIILDYYKAEKVLQNIEGLCLQQGDFNLEIVVGDNSGDKNNAELLRKGIEKAQKQYPHISFLLELFHKNLGYTVGNNILVQKSSGETVCILNPDIHWKDTDVLRCLLERLESSPELGIIAPAQKELPHLRDALSVRSFPSFITQVARRTWLRKIEPFSTRVKKDEMQHIDRTQEQEVDWLQSSFFMLDRSLWDQLGGFDERYFLFLADTQMCLDCWKKGKKVWYFPHVKVYSDGLRCSDGGVFALFTSRALRIHVVDSMKYFFKNVSVKCLESLKKSS